MKIFRYNSITPPSLLPTGEAIRIFCSFALDFCMRGEDGMGGREHAGVD